MPELLLASASPRRRELLTQLGVQFTVVPANIDESILPGELPESYVRRMAAGKAEAGRRSAGGRPALGADTAVIIDDRILGKPRDRADALDMLELLAGRTHQVISGVAVADGTQVLERLSTTKVSFGPISAAEREAYWATGEPRDKAGAYAIQGYGAVFVRHINGSYTGVVGLPLYETAELLRCIGLNPGSGPADS
ncbi:MAG: Maf family protein [Gammaproteobacteria bacterium]|nr:Maf family protein [Gammaproteobacteria bacterium]MDP6616753.1 Maf family protein [Gammaproteobacteria bacterium]MDP6695182.1 Maf family protein [Gammaproteobacteria bacterium]MDP7041483.1 Maf family protein [Gammaproteobacteria bacterium]